MEEENLKQNPTERTENAAPDLGKFKSVEALVRAYGELEAEFTRRSQRLKALEEAQHSAEEKRDVMDDEALYLAASQNEGLRARILSDYLTSLKGVPLLGGVGAGVTAPVHAPKTIREAGTLALGYLKNQNN